MQTQTMAEDSPLAVTAALWWVAVARLCYQKAAAGPHLPDTYISVSSSPASANLRLQLDYIC